MTILNISPLTTEEPSGIVNEHLEDQFEIKQGVVYAAFPTKEDYGYASNQSTEGDALPRGTSVQGRSDNLRSEATQSLLREISQAKGSKERQKLAHTELGNLVFRLGRVYR